MKKTAQEKIETCKQTREIASNGLSIVLEKVLSDGKQISEVEFRDLWLVELQKNDGILSEGWYTPPPYGIGVLFGKDTDGENSRLNFQSLRPEEIWPKKNVKLDLENGIIFTYASPINKETGVVGDFGVTIYLGRQNEIISQLKLCKQVVDQTFESIKVGMTFDDVARHMKSLIDENGLINEIECQTSPSSADDVGHTIPFVSELVPEKFKQSLSNGDLTEVRNTIRHGRIFARAGVNNKIEAGMAFTIEPRPMVKGNPKIPMTWFHSICVIHTDGRKELLTNFDQIFRTTGMDYMMG